MTLVNGSAAHRSPMKQICATLLCLCPCLALAQTLLYGNIKDQKSKQRLAGATVEVLGSVDATVTRLDGTFRLPTGQAPPLRLRVSHPGHQTTEVELATRFTTVELPPDNGLTPEPHTRALRWEEDLAAAPVTIEKLDGNQLWQSPAWDSYDALQYLKGVDLLAQNMTFRSVNLRGFGANNNNRFLQWTDGMDNRSPGLGIGFGNVAGVSELDIASIELQSGAASALYGPDALQGIMLTQTKSPFTHQGLSAYLKAGMNNFGRADGSSPTPFADVALRYARPVGRRFAFKVNLQALRASELVADDYDDRSTRSRLRFFNIDRGNNLVSLDYQRNNDPASNFEYDGVNIYGDDITNGGAFDFPANYPKAALAGKKVTRTGYTERELLGGNPMVHSYRANAGLYWKLGGQVEVSANWYFGTGNLLRTAGFREYFPNYRRHQGKIEVRGGDFYLRIYKTWQMAEGYNLGTLAQRILNHWEPMSAWANAFASAFKGDLSAAREAADAGKLKPGDIPFDSLRQAFIATLNTDFIPNSTSFKGVQLLDNSTLGHAEGQWQLDRHLPKNMSILVGGNVRRYIMLTKGTIFPTTFDGSEFTIREMGAYLQAAYKFDLGEAAFFKPSATVRYDKNEYFSGGFTPRLAAVLGIEGHYLRGSWQTAFRNPSPNQLLADGKIGEVGGSEAALNAANLYENPAYSEASVKLFQTSGDSSVLMRYDPKPEAFTTEKVETWEVGYRARLSDRLYADVLYYHSGYRDFIATQNFYQPISGSIKDLKSASGYRTYQINFNNFNEIDVDGFAVGLEFNCWKGFIIGGNYARQVGRVTLRDNAGNIRNDALGTPVRRRKMSDPAVSQAGRNFFISPEDRFNISLRNPRLTPRLGFSLHYRFTGRMWVEQGNTQGDVWLPAWQTLDAALIWSVPRANSQIKIAATNLLNRYYAQGYGLAQIGGLYYVGWMVRV